MRCFCYQFFGAKTSERRKTSRYRSLRLEKTDNRWIETMTLIISECYREHKRDVNVCAERGKQRNALNVIHSFHYLPSCFLANKLVRFNVCKLSTKQVLTFQWAYTHLDFSGKSLLFTHKDTKRQWQLHIYYQPQAGLIDRGIAMLYLIYSGILVFLHLQTDSSITWREGQS